MRDKVINSARQLGLEVEVKRLDESTRTVQEAARALGCEAGEIAKSLVFVADGDPVIVIAPGDRRVDTDKLAETLDVAEVRQAGPDEVRAATGFPVGGVPPFGHGLPAIVDEELLRRERVFAAGGDGHSLFEVEPRRLVECTRARVAAVTA